MPWFDVYHFWNIYTDFHWSNGPLIKNLPYNKESSEYSNSEDSKKRKLEETSEKNGDTKKANMETSFVTGVPLTTMAGHTGYLTFATLKPDLSQTNWLVLHTKKPKLRIYLWHVHLW